MVVIVVMSQVVHGSFVCTVSDNFFNFHSIFYYLIEAQTDFILSHKNQMHTTTLIADETVHVIMSPPLRTNTVFIDCMKYPSFHTVPF